VSFPTIDLSHCDPTEVDRVCRDTGFVAIVGHEFPEKLIDEKRELLEDLLTRNGRLYFTHDHGTALARIVRDERGRFGVAEDLATLEGLTI